MKPIKKAFLERAKDVYYRGDVYPVVRDQHSSIEEVEEDGVPYVVLSNSHRVLAVYRPGLFGRPELTDFVPPAFRDV